MHNIGIIYTLKTFNIFNMNKKRFHETLVRSCCFIRCLMKETILYRVYQLGTQCIPMFCLIYYLDQYY
jgi:hypothetical protein